MSPAKTLKHHLEHSVINKYHLLFQLPVCPALYCLAGLYFTTSFKRSHINLPQETGKLKNKIPLRLFNAQAPSVAHKIYHLRMHSWGSLLGVHPCLCTLAEWLLSQRQNWRDLLLCSHVGLCFHLHIYFEDLLVVLYIPINATIQGLMMGLQALMISPCSPHWGPYRCCTSLCNNSLGAKGRGFHLHLKIGEKCLHHQIPKTLINLSFPIDKADVQWERKTNEQRSEGICLLSQSSSWHSQARDSGDLFAFLLCSGHFLHSTTVLLWKHSCKTRLFKNFNSNAPSLQAPGDDSEQ